MAYLTEVTSHVPDNRPKQTGQMKLTTFLKE